MMVWINGAFGAGKSSVAAALLARWPQAWLFDPEQIGFLLRDLLPPAGLPADFQDLPIWRELTVTLLAEADRRSLGPVVVPMTLVVPAYFEQIVTDLRQRGHQLSHFSLIVSPEVLRQRLAGRGDGPDSWPARQIPRCVAALADARFARHLPADAVSPAELAERIALLA